METKHLSVFGDTEFDLPSAWSGQDETILKKITISNDLVGWLKKVFSFSFLGVLCESYCTYILTVIA